MSTDGEDEGAKKGAKEEGVKKAAAAPAPTPSGNQVGALDKGGNSETSPSKRRLTRSFVDRARNTIQLESLSPSPVVSPVKGLGDMSGKSMKVGADSLGTTLLKKKEEPKAETAETTAEVTDKEADKEEEKEDNSPPEKQPEESAVDEQ